MASRAIYIAVAAIGIASASGIAWWYQNMPASKASDAAATAPAPTRGTPVVEAARVEELRLTDEVQAVGSLSSRQSVVLRPEVSGRVTQINFRDGERVRRGQLLVQLDDQLPRAQLKQAEAELSIAYANHERNRELAEQNFISRRSVDESAANLEVAQAKLALARATVARLRIVAPFDGVAGIRTINVGDYLKDGADMVNIEDLDAIYVDFRLPERFQSKLRRGQTAWVDVDAITGRRYEAKVQAIDPLVDAQGRSIGIRGCIDNRHLQLRPGMFARITTVFGMREKARVIPEEAIVPQGGTLYVYRLADAADQDTRIAQRVEVKVGLRQPGRVEVTQGLQTGDMVVTAGHQRIQKDGAPVRVMEVGKGTQPPTNGQAVPINAGPSVEIVATPQGRSACDTPARGSARR